MKGRSKCLAELTQQRRDQWLKLAKRYLPIAPDGSIWRYSRRLKINEPTQGWKLHLSATILNANQILKRIGPLLTESNVSFKGPASLDDLYQINSGLVYPYTQVGKVFTIYPRSDEECRELAAKLDKLTRGLSAPKVPFDLRYAPRSNVYYRYGAFSSAETTLESGEAMIRDPTGVLVADRRDIAKPDWLVDLIAPANLQEERGCNSHAHLKSDYRVFRALVQRGKGGVYQALDLTTDPPRLCLIKEGRKSGEVSWEGRDGKSRVKNERDVLQALQKIGVEVPRVYSSFEEHGNFYLVTEFIAGESLHSYLRKRKRRLPIPTILRYSIELTSILARLHASGWVWRDCKPANLLISNGSLRPLDFEGACKIDKPAGIPWSSPSFSKTSRNSDSATVVNDDLYALAAVIYLLLTGRIPERTPIPPVRLREQTPEELSSLVWDLLTSEKLELSAEVVGKKLTECLVLTRRSREHAGAFTSEKAA